jgi:hypothetical protein
VGFFLRARYPCRHPRELVFLYLARVDELGRHQLDELLLPTPRMENLKAQAGITEHILACSEHGWRCCLVLAHKVEQNAHVPRGPTRLSACLMSVEGSVVAGCLLSARWIW